MFVDGYAWLIIFAGWLLLLLLGLDGDDPPAVGQPGRQPVTMAVARWLTTAVAVALRSARRARPVMPHLPAPPAAPVSEGSL
jgi:hypothetical protein